MRQGEGSYNMQARGAEAGLQGKVGVGDEAGGGELQHAAGQGG